jgi:3',5'-cyclic AMP phosphodiesterase CpdA
MQPNAAISIVAPNSARRPGAWEGRGGGPYVHGDEVGEPPMHPPGVAPGPYDVPVGATLTEAEPGATWTFASIGDYGAGTKPQAQVAATLLARRPDLLVTVGDNVYNFGLELEYRHKWDKPEYFGRIREQIPVFPSLGNHDVRLGTPRAYFRRFPELDRARYYAFQRGGVQFVALDSNQSLAPGSDQYKWLSSTLQDAKDAAYRVLYMHHPLKSSQPRSDDHLLRDLGPLLEQAKVDLVLTGHEHHYERTKPLNGYGTVAVTHGGGGNEIHPFQTPQAEWSAARSADYGFLTFDVTADALVGHSVLADGREVDTFRVPKGGLAAANAGAAHAA